MKRFVTLLISISMLLSTPVLASERIVIGGYSLYGINGEKVGEMLIINDNGTIVHERKVEQEIEPTITLPTEIEPTETLSADSEIELEIKSIPPLTEPPIVGTVLGNIMKEGDNLPVDYSSSYTEHYATYSIGQCAWYTNGRLREVTGVYTHIAGSAKDWIINASKDEKLYVELDINNIEAQSVAVYRPKSEKDLHPGHVVFIEYVEKDESGNPINIFYTDANGNYDTELHVYTPGVDGAVRMESYDEFIKGTNLYLAGYVKLNPDYVVQN